MSITTSGCVRRSKPAKLNSNDQYSCIVPVPQKNAMPDSHQHSISLDTPSSSYKTLLTIVGLFTCFAAYIADWNKTHIYNPRWPPHAKFHNGQTMSMGLALGAATLYYLWRPLKAGTAKCNLETVTIFASLYWVTQLSGILYPGTRFTDPEFGDGAVQPYICSITLTVIWLGYVFESGRIARANSR